jgi:hypothetical protein
VANGSSREEVARADRMRERAKQAQRGTDNALEALQRAKLDSVNEFDEDSVVTLTKEGLSAKGVPKWAVGAAVVLVAAAGAAWILLKAFGK